MFNHSSPYYLSIIFLITTIKFSQSSGLCYYKMLAISGPDGYTFPPVKPLPENGGQSTITISLPPNKNFILTITAFNGYGNTNFSSVAISESLPLYSRK